MIHLLWLALQTCLILLGIVLAATAAFLTLSTAKRNRELLEVEHKLKLAYMLKLENDQLNQVLALPKGKDERAS